MMTKRSRDGLMRRAAVSTAVSVLTPLVAIVPFVALTVGADPAWAATPVTGTTKLTSVAAAGGVDNAANSGPSVDNRGDVVFASSAPLVTADANGKSDVYLRTAAGKTLLISRAAGNGSANDVSGVPSISRDGRYIAFQSTATNVAGHPTNGQSQIWLYDRDASSDGVFDQADVSFTLQSVSISSSQGGDAASTNPVVAYLGTETADAPYVAFESHANDLVVDANDAAQDLYLRANNAATNKITRSTTGGSADGASFAPAISAWAGVVHVAFESDADNLAVPDDANQVRDVFLYSLTLSTSATSVLRISRPSTGDANGASQGASVSTTGSRVAYTSSATNLGPTDTNNVADVYVTNLPSLSTSLVSVSAANEQGNNTSDSARISGNAKIVTFRSFATNLVPGDTNQTRDVFLSRLGSFQTQRLSISSDGGQAAGQSEQPAIDYTGALIAFASTAPNLVASDTNGVSDIFLRRQDITPPAAPTATSAAGDRHPVGAWSNQVLITYLANATDTGTPTSGVVGYHDIYDHHAKAVPSELSGSSPYCPVTTGTTGKCEDSLSDSADLQWWYLHVRAVDAAGNWGPTTNVGPFKIDTVGPANISMHAELPSDTYTDLKSSVTVDWHAVDAIGSPDPLGFQLGGSGIKNYDVYYDRASAYGGGFGARVTVLIATTKTSASVAVAKGYYYRFWFRARDNAGNTTSLRVGDGFANFLVPLDDTALTHSADWTTTRNSLDYGGSAEKSDAVGATLTWTVHGGASYNVVYTACSVCGRFEVLLDGQVVRTISTQSTTTRHERLTSIHDGYALSDLHAHTLTIKALASATVGPTYPVYIDGLGILMG